MTQSGLFGDTSEPRIPSIKEIMLPSGSQQGGICAHGASFRGAETPQRGPPGHRRELTTMLGKLSGFFCASLLRFKLRGRRPTSPGNAEMIVCFPDDPAVSQSAPSSTNLSQCRVSTGLFLAQHLTNIVATGFLNVRLKCPLWSKSRLFQNARI